MANAEGIRRLTGLQKEAILLYRAALRAIRTKPEESRPGFLAYLRSQFEAKRNVSPKDFQRVEDLLRRGRRQLEAMSKPEVAGVMSTPASQGRTSR